MRLALERGVPQEERQKVALGSLTDWDAARIFLEVVRCGSFRSAAERLGLSINVVRRRIDDFERQIGATLFTRDVHGTRLTDEGIAGRFGGRTHGGRVVRPAARQQFRRQYAVGRSPGRRHRGPGHVLAGPSPRRIPAIVPEYPGRPALRDALGRRVAARGRRRDPSVAADRARRQTGPARPHASDVLCQPEIHRDLWRAENGGRTGQASAGDAGRRPDRRQGSFREPVSRVIPSATCW